MFKAYGEMWKNAFNLKGRTTRRDYWLIVLLNILIGIPLGIISVLLPFGGVISMACNIIIMFPSLSLMVRRLHDSGHSGKFLVGFYMLVVCDVFFMILLCRNFIMEIYYGIKEGNGLNISISSLKNAEVVGMFLPFVIITTIALAVFGIILLVRLAKPGSPGENEYGKTAPEKGERVDPRAPR